MFGQILMERLFLIFEKHNLVNTFAQLVLVETAEDVFGVALVQDLDEFIMLQFL